MATRLLEIFIPQERLGELEKMLDERPTHSKWFERMSDSKVHYKILVASEAVEGILNDLEKAFTYDEGFRVLIMPVEAVIPRCEFDRKEHPDLDGVTGSRVSRHEIYNDIAEAARPSVVFYVLVALSTILASLGLVRNNAAVIIGAMVIAPFLGPNVAFSLATTLADSKLARKAGLLSLAGIALCLPIAFLMGIILNVNPMAPEIALRTEVAVTDVVLALVAGCAGVLAFTSAVPSALIGVMVAVALLPPFAASGMLAGEGCWVEAWKAFLLFLTNLICINLAGVVTFLVQGIQPLTWWEKGRARKAARTSILVWAALMMVLVGLIFWSGRL